MRPFRLRLNCVDHYLAVPTVFDPPVYQDGSRAGSTQPRMPVIRVFGATPTGQKACIHVHGMLPYLYIEYIGGLSADEVESYIHRLHLSIDYALAVSFRRRVGTDQPSFVAHISLVKAVPFYGYNVGYKFFLKIYLFNPLHIIRLADLLRQGAVLRKALQPFESHMQYVPQWMCDFNLFGCDYMDCQKLKFRGPIPICDEVDNPSHDWHSGNIDPSMVSNASLARQSHCTLEADVCVQDILNRLEVKPRPIHHIFLEALTSSQVEDKLVTSMAGLWRDETRRRKARMGLKDADGTPFPPEVLVSVSADPRDTNPGGWIHENEYREKFRQLIEAERDAENEPIVLPKTTSKARDFEGTIRTSFESIEDLFPENINQTLSARRMLRVQASATSQAGQNEVEVDEQQAQSYEKDYLKDELESDLSDMLEDEPNDVPDQPIEEHDSIEALIGMPKANSNIAKGAQRQKPLKPQRPVSKQDMTTRHGDFSLSGVRAAGEYVPTPEDAFEIPNGFASNIDTSLEQLVSSKRPADDETKQEKRRKLHHNGFDSSGANENDDSKGQADAFISVLDEKQTPSGRKAEHIVAGGSRHAAETLPGSEAATAQPDSENPAKLPQPNETDHSTETFSGTSQGPRPSKQATSITDKAEQHGRYRRSATYPRVARPTMLASTCATVVASNLSSSFGDPAASATFILRDDPPQAALIQKDLAQGGLPTVVYQDAHYGQEDDVPERGRIYGGREFKIPGTTTQFLPDFDPTGRPPLPNRRGLKQARQCELLADEPGCDKSPCPLMTWELRTPPPSTSEVKDWLLAERESQRAKDGGGTGTQLRQMSQIDAATPKHKFGFKYSQKKKPANVTTEAQYMSIMSLEVHVNSRGDLLPNPDLDEVACVFWCLQSEHGGEEVGESQDQMEMGIIMLSDPEDQMSYRIRRDREIQVDEESSELDLLNKVVDVVRMLDPDILTGFEVHDSSWGYLIERARRKYEFRMCDELSRIKSDTHGRFGKEADRWGFNQTSTIRVTGRHVINIWRALRGELDLLQYTMENIAFHVLHRRIPHYPFADLTRWYKSGRPCELGRVLDYWLSRTRTDLEILERNELVSRTSEQARLLGVDFYAVFARGSQFKVESLMSRIAKPENFVLISPSRKQVGQQNALECLPMVMEPQSAFYTSPVLVLDFQSLYPSVMIAYNYCYSTFLGRVVTWRGQNKMGFTDFERQPGLLEALQTQVNIAPNGIMYARPSVRKSLLAKMLGEILETRVMVKSGMKVDKEDRQLQRLLNNRQLALKLIANVTYGYTSASFSGRMPCSEIADSIVQTGRETLERAIALIHSVKKWRAEVVYGDTDSLFVLLKGRSRDEAFDIGQEISKTITDMNPRPVKLKFEKVYHPCVLLAKKRYVGFKYEHRDQKEPEFDAKGIETVRRDGTPAEQKIEETALKILFRTADLSQVKDYVQRQCLKIMQGRVSIQDFCFAKEVKLGTYSDKGPPPTGALISTRRMLEDPRAEPQYGERVPYVVITGAPGARLIDRCVGPDVLLRNEDNELDADYYISKNILPPLERIFNLVGANVRQWYDEMPKFQRIRKVEAPTHNFGAELMLSKKTLESYMRASACLVCKAKIEARVPICLACRAQPAASLLTLRTKMRRAETRAVELHKICRSCAGVPFGEAIGCDSKDCPVFYSRVRHMARLRSSKALSVPIIALLETEEGSLEW